MNVAVLVQGIIIEWQLTFPGSAQTDWSLVSTGSHSMATNNILQGAAKHRLSSAMASTV